MAGSDLDFSFELLQSLIDTFDALTRDLEASAWFVVQNANSSDPVSEVHTNTVKPLEDRMYQAATESMRNAREGAQITYNGFKDADIA